MLIFEELVEGRNYYAKTLHRANNGNQDTMTIVEVNFINLFYPIVRIYVKY